MTTTETALKAMHIIEKMVDADLDHFLNHHMSSMTIMKHSCEHRFEPEVPEWFTTAAASSLRNAKGRQQRRQRNPTNGASGGGGGGFSPWIQEVSRKTFLARKAAVTRLMCLLHTLGVAFLSAPFLATNLYFLLYLPTASVEESHQCLYREFDPVRLPYRLDMLLWFDTAVLVYTIGAACVSVVFFLGWLPQLDNPAERELYRKCAQSWLYLQHRLMEWISVVYFALYLVLFCRVFRNCVWEFQNYSIACLALRAFSLFIYFVNFSN